MAQPLSHELGRARARRGGASCCKTTMCATRARALSRMTSASALNGAVMSFRAAGHWCSLLLT